jgi:hypothetical protein
MGIRFDPPLGATTVLPLPPAFSEAAEVDLTLRATFDTPAEAAQALADGLRIEIWSDLPVPGRAQGEWGALAFATDRAPARPDLPAGGGGPRSFAIAPDAPLSARVAPDAEPDVLKIKLKTKFPKEGGRYSFTFRVVDPNNNIRWLGNSSNNGVFIVERRDERIELGEGWTTTETGESVWSGEHETAVGTLNSKFEWAAWIIGRDG